MKIIFKNYFSVNIGISFIAALILSMTLGYLKEYIMSFASILLHELSHVSAAAVMGAYTKNINIIAVGLNAEIDEQALSNKKKVIVYLSGPAMNLFLSAVLFLFMDYYLNLTDSCHFFMLINIYMAVFNLIPVMPLDGGKILREILLDRVGIYKTHSHIIHITKAIAFLIICIGIFQLYISFNNISLFIIGIYIILNIKWGKDEVAFMNIKNVIYRRSKLLKKGIYPARDLVVMKWLNLGELLKSLDYDRFHFVHVLDEDLRLIKTVTEQEVIDWMLNNEGDITFEEFVNLAK